MARRRAPLTHKEVLIALYCTFFHHGIHAVDRIDPIFHRTAEIFARELSIRGIRIEQGLEFNHYGDSLTFSSALYSAIFNCKIEEQLFPEDLSLLNVKYWGKKFPRISHPIVQEAVRKAFEVLNLPAAVRAA